MRLRRMRTFIIAHAMYSYADEGQIIIVITTNIVSNTVGYRSPISVAEISLILDPRGIRHTRTILLYLLSHTCTHTHTHACMHIYIHIHIHRSAKKFCGFSFVSNNSIVAVDIFRECISSACFFFTEYDRSEDYNRGDRTDHLFSRPRKRPFLRLPRLSIFHILSRIS